MSSLAATLRPRVALVRCQQCVPSTSRATIAAVVPLYKTAAIGSSSSTGKKRWQSTSSDSAKPASRSAASTDGSRQRSATNERSSPSAAASRSAGNAPLRYSPFLPNPSGSSPIVAELRNRSRKSSQREGGNDKNSDRNDGSSASGLKLGGPVSSKQAAKRRTGSALSQAGFGEGFTASQYSSVMNSRSNEESLDVLYEHKSTAEVPLNNTAHRPSTPTSSRTLLVSKGPNFLRQYRRLMSGIIGLNNVRDELRRQERYEKPKYVRQRLRSARHRRRFALEIATRVSAVMKAKSQGM